MGGLRVVTLDADNTLWDFDLMMRTALGHVIAHLEAMNIPGSNSLTIDAMVAAREEVFQESASAGLRLKEIRERAFARSLERIGHPDARLAAVLNRVYLDHRFRGVRLYVDVLPALEALAPRYRLGLVTNGNSYPERCGLDGWFDFAVFGQDCGFLKPDPRIFAVAMEAAHCAPEELVHVGDSTEADVVGALAAGARAVWLNRDGRSPPAGHPVCPVIRSLRELPAIVASMSSDDGARSPARDGHR